ncbi:MAG: heavy-metal-associated domain-containing protein [Alphaproteobacteria bacterium]|nr:heavy-metal-associated domain-containing protein [Alphaproteobacteria bacterium]
MSAAQSPAAGEVELSVNGMTCAGCVNSVVRALSRVPGVARVDVDLGAGRARVKGTAGSATLVAAIRKAGYGASVAPSGDTES